MRPRSETFDAACAGSHKVIVEATVETTDGETVDLPIGEGSTVTLDGTAASRASLDLGIPVGGDTDLIPTDSGDPLTPFGNEITVVRGVETADGVEERIQLGVFRIDEVRLADRGELTIEVAGLDRSSIIIDAVFEQSGTVAKGTNALDAAAGIITEAYPGVVLDFVDSTVELPLLSYEIGDDRWDFAHACAEAAGCHLYFNGDGTCVATPVLETTLAALTVAEGEGGVLLGADTQWGRENATNRVTVAGESSGNDPVFGEALDEDPGSPTYYHGPFGKATYAYSSVFVTDAEQAEAVAQNILAIRRGVGKQVSFEALVNPALEPFDAVKVTRSRLNLDELHVIDTLTIPLDYDGTMSATTRVARVL